MSKQVSMRTARLSPTLTCPCSTLPATGTCVAAGDRARVLYGGDYRAWILRIMERYELESASLLSAGNRPTRLVR